jgi:hypothetical protein
LIGDFILIQQNWTLLRKVLGSLSLEIQHFVKRAIERSMSNNDLEKKKIVLALKKLNIQETELLERLERLSLAETSVSSLPAARGFAIGDKVHIRNPKPLQAKKGTILKIGNRITVLAPNGTKIVRAPKNLIHIS